MVQLALLSRLLSPSDFGLMAMIMVVIVFAQSYTDMGVNNAIIHYQLTDKQHLSSLFWLNLFVGIGLFLTMIIVTPLVVMFYHEARLANLLLLTSVVFLVIPIGQQFQILLERELLFGRVAFAEIMSTLSGTGIALLCALAGFGVYSLVLGLLMRSLVKSLSFFLIGLRQWQPMFHFRIDDLKRYLSFGFYQMGERSINYLAWNLDKIIIGSLLGAQALGFYSIAYQIMSLPFSMFNPIITRVAFPVFAKIQSDDYELRRGYLAAIRAIAFVLFPVYTGMIILAKPLFLIAVGREWLPAIPVFQILCILGYFYSIGNPIGSLLLAKGRVKIGFYLNILVFILYSLAIWIGSSYGVTGIAISLVLSQACILFPLGFWIRWLLVHMGTMEYLKAFSPMLICSAAMGGFVQYIKSPLHFIDNYILNFALLAVVGIMIYLLAMLLWKKEELIRLFNFVGD